MREIASVEYHCGVVMATYVDLFSGIGHYDLIKLGILFDRLCHQSGASLSTPRLASFMMEPSCDEEVEGALTDV